LTKKHQIIILISANILSWGIAYFYNLFFAGPLFLGIASVIINQDNFKYPISRYTIPVIFLLIFGIATTPFIYLAQQIGSNLELFFSLSGGLILINIVLKLLLSQYRYRIQETLIAIALGTLSTFVYIFVTNQNLSKIKMTDRLDLLILIFQTAAALSIILGIWNKALTQDEKI
jgi:uncharacterized membrane protein